MSFNIYGTLLSDIYLKHKKEIGNYSDSKWFKNGKVKWFYLFIYLEQQFIISMGRNTWILLNEFVLKGFLEVFKIMEFSIMFAESSSALYYT